ncbi:MAG: copper amine oxidase N-terminal domain-containing protein [Defluviitaleaceae bacterium]|nr:copper amine oxidase N-terminal domain-containing protein [Defluviitaleaceae bacterium]
MKNLKKILPITFILLLALAMLPLTAYATTPIRVYVNGQQAVFQDQDPIMVNGRVLVPVRGVFELMGFEVTPDSGAAIISDGDTTIVIPFGGDYFTVNGEIVSPEVPPQIINNRLLLPLRAVAEALGAEPVWDGPSRTATITTANQELESEQESEPETPDPSTFQRRWQHPNYINPSPQTTESNNQLAIDLQHLHDNTINRNTNSFPWELWGSWQPQNLPVLSPLCEAFNTQLRLTLQQGFANEAMSTALPFNEAYWYSFTNAVTYHVWRLAWDEPAMALWTIPRGLQDGIHIFMGTDLNQWPYPQDRFFAHFIFHEIANVLGLGDPVAELFAEELTGRPSIWGCCMRHDATFARVLFERVGAIEFWRAAFTSNANVVAHWEYHFGGILPASYLQMAFGVDYAIKNNPQLVDMLYAATGIDSEARLGIASMFARVNDLSISQALRDEYARQAAALVALIYEWGVENDISPYPFVDDVRVAWREIIMGV